jgi:DNA-binding MarR family transcriptional regulator
MSVSGELLVGEIADLLLVRHHAAVELINRLEEAQLVQRRLDRSDGRKVHVALTLRAEKLLNKLSEAHSLELRMTRPGLFALLNRL